METIRVIGCGIIRNLIYKMQFLNALEYFLTIEYDEHSTMTLWDGGCRVYSRSAATVETKQSQNEVPKTNQQPKRKRFVPTLPRSNNRPQTSKTSTPRFRSEKPQVTKPLNGPKAVSGNLNGELEFVTVGKYHLSFWQVQDCEMDTDEASNGGLKIPQPEFGDFGKKFFRAEFITSCQATNKFLDGCIITGDSNGTLLMWSEKSKEAVKGFPHAHECYIASLCVSETGYIFTAGAKDRLVKAFCFKKSKLECCGCQKIPAEVGSATCLIVLENNLFVATEKNWILLLNIDSNITSEVSSSTQTQQLFLPGENAKSPSSKTLYHRASTPSLTVALENESPKNAKIQLSQEHGVFSEWIADEVARGLGGRKGGITCVCSLRPLKLKRRIKRASYCDSQQVSIPTPDEGAAIVRNQLAMSSGLRRSFNERNIKQNPPSKIVYAWKNKENSKDESAMKRPISSISSPHLWTDKRIMSREKAREEETLVATPPFALTNHVMKKQVYCDDPTRPSVIGDCFVTSSFDGVIMIYSSKEHKIIARCNLPDVDEVNSIDACSRRHLVVVGTKKGQVTVARIDANDFEIFPTIKCRCSGGGLPTINALRFSPSGRKLAISIGYDVIVHNVHSLHLSEQGRCIGHYSDTITGIDWSKRKYSGTYFLRTCATSPVPEVKTWHSETMVEVNGRDILTRVQWASSSCILDYPIKGIWNKFTSASDVTSCAVYATQSNQDTMAIQEEKKTSNSSYLSSSGGGESFVCIGDATGKLHTQLYPCLDWRECSENVFRAHSSPIRSLASLPSGFILSTSHNDSSLVQWSIKGK